jgi:hypothetical protein
MAFLRRAAYLKIAGSAAYDIYLYRSAFRRNDGSIVRIASQDIQAASV